MQLGTELPQQTCPRCFGKLTVPVVFRENQWYHRACWDHGAHQLAEATKISQAITRMQKMIPPRLLHASTHLLSSSNLNFQPREASALLVA
jgi:hypothetical protein